MEYHSIEGTWEEILAHTSELSGHRVRVTVLDDRSGEIPTTAETPKSLAEALQGRVGRLSFDVPDLSDSKAADIFTDIVVQKHKGKAH